MGEFRATETLQFQVTNDMPEPIVTFEWYDTKEAIAEKITTLQGLNELINARREAGYVRHQRMREFCILGSYMLDTCGNCGVIDNFKLRENIPDLPSVVTHEELWQFVTAFDLKRMGCYIILF
jgi:hypothetical protein